MRCALAGAVDGAVCPAVEECADEAFCFAVGLWAIGARAEVPDTEGVTGECMDGGAVCASVVGEQLLDGDPVAGIESERSLEKPDRGGGFSSVRTSA